LPAGAWDAARAGTLEQVSVSPHPTPRSPPRRVLEDATGRRLERMRWVGRAVALLFLVWLALVILGGLGVNPVRRLPLGHALRPSSGPPPARHVPTPSPPAPAALVPAPPARARAPRRRPAACRRCALCVLVLAALRLSEGFATHTIGASGEPHDIHGAAPLTGSRPILTPAGGKLVSRQPPPGRRVALTFDDGPDPRWTPKIAAVLRAAHVRATFFVIGS